MLLVISTIVISRITTIVKSIVVVVSTTISLLILIILILTFALNALVITAEFFKETWVCRGAGFRGSVVVVGTVLVEETMVTIFGNGKVCVVINKKFR